MEAHRVADVTAAARMYGAVLLCARLLRALVAAGFLAALLFVVLIVVCIVWAGVAFAGWMFAGLPWLQLAINMLIGGGIVLAFFFALAVEVFIGVALYRAVLRGAAGAGYLVVVVSLLGVLAAAVDMAYRVLAVLSGPEASAGGELLAAASNLFPLYIGAAFLYAGIGVIRLSRHPMRDALTVHAPKRGFRTGLVQLVGWPSANLTAARRRRVRRLAGLAFACEAMAFATYFASRSSEPPDLPFQVGLIVTGLGYVVTVACLYGLLALADWLWRRSRQAGQLSFTESTAIDGRAPILFLRSFTDDQVSLGGARVPLVLRVLDPGVSAHQFEELVVANLSPLGPVVAIGRPGDEQPPIGAARQYVPDDIWRPYVTRLMAQAQLIVVSLSATQGLEWELDLIRDERHLHKTMLVVPPTLADQPATVAERASRAGVVSTIEVASQAEKRPLAIWSNSNGSEALVVTSRPTELAYDLALRLFAGERLNP